MNRVIVIHVYYGTVGNAGLYIKKIVDSTVQCSFDTCAIVSKYFPDTGIKYYKHFFQISDRMDRGLVRKLIRFAELTINYFTAFKLIKKISTKYNMVIINFSLNENFKPTYYFLCFLKEIKKIKIGISVHDVKPFKQNYSKLIMQEQDEILGLADFFIVHNEYSKNILERKFPGKKSLIFKYRFPLMDLNFIAEDKKIKRENLSENTVKFLFIGILRDEKGLELLIEAWKRIQGKYENIQLTIAGLMQNDAKYDFSGLNRTRINNSYLSDDDYIKHILDTNYIVLPYKKGTNSGILSTTSSLGKPAITSDLSMFKESEFCIDSLMFISNDIDSLTKLLENTILSHELNYPILCEEVNKKIKKYNDEFQLEVITTYNDILSKFVEIM